VLFQKQLKMKKIIFSALFFAAVSGYAQDQDYTVTNLDMVEYENNSVHVFNVHGTFDDPIDEAKLHLVINNTTSDPIYVTGEVVEISNTNGEMAQFCIGGPAGNCFFPLFEGGFYPNTDGGVVPANANWGFNDYLINLDPTNLSEYTIRFLQTDGEGNEIPNTSFFLTYRYDENMSVSDMNSVAIAKVYPTVVKNTTTVNLKENAVVQVLNLQGKTVKSLNLKSGVSQLDLSGLSAGVYLIQFKGNSGLTTTTKVVVK